jgi:hypothetical protein
MSYTECFLPSLSLRNHKSVTPNCIPILQACYPVPLVRRSLAFLSMLLDSFAHCVALFIDPSLDVLRSTFEFCFVKAVNLDD